MSKKSCASSGECRKARFCEWRGLNGRLIPPKTVQPVGTAWVKIVLARIFIHRFPLRERPFMSKKSCEAAESAVRHGFP